VTNRVSRVVLVLTLLVAAVGVGSGCGLRVTDPTAPAAVATSELPPQARETLELIDRGGPYPFAQDGAVFHNREGLLPAQPDGYYREFTVVTPGSPDRGARRIVAGDGGERYYTDDHYASFQEVTP
jgi:ribonuclease T1